MQTRTPLECDDTTTRMWCKLKHHHWMWCKLKHHHSKLVQTQTPLLECDANSNTTTRMWCKLEHHHSMMQTRTPPLECDANSNTTTRMWCKLKHHHRMWCQPEHHHSNVMQTRTPQTRTPRTPQTRTQVQQWRWNEIHYWVGQVFQAHTHISMIPHLCSHHGTRPRARLPWPREEQTVTFVSTGLTAGMIHSTSTTIVRDVRARISVISTYFRCQKCSIINPLENIRLYKPHFNARHTGTNTNK